MINVKFIEKDGLLLSFNIKGHADYKNSGEDIVCSAVSAVSQTTLLGLLEVIKVSPLYSMKEGFLQVNIDKLDEDSINKCQILMKTMLKGLLNMELGYGNYIKVTVEEV